MDDLQTIREQVRNLPQEIKKFVAVDTWPDKLASITQIYGLSGDEAAEVKAEVFLIIVGLENISDLTKNLQNTLTEVEYGKLSNIVKDIEENILFEIRPQLLEIEIKNKEVERKEEGLLHKDEILNLIENPTPAIPRSSEPAENVLDAQHFLPEGEHNVLIGNPAAPSSTNTKLPASAVPSKGPYIGPKIPPAPKNYTIDPYREPIQ